MKPVKPFASSTGLQPRRTLLAGIFCVFILLTPVVFALDPAKSISQYNCQTWTRQNGFPANGVNAVTQTKDGYIWLGTPAGLVRFDGINFQHSDLKETAQIRSSFVRSLSASRNGGFWLGLNLGSFAFCDGKDVTFRGKDEWGSLSLNVLSLLETRNGDLWIAAQTLAGRLTPAGTFETILPPPGKSEFYDVSAVYEDERGRVWLGTTLKGLYYWQEGTLNKFPDPALDQAVIRSVVVDRQGRIWVGTQTGVVGYDAAFQKIPIQVSQSESRALLVDHLGALWVGTSGEGLVRYWNGTVTRLRKVDGLAGDFITALAEDRENSLWVGTRSGLSQLSDIKIPTFGQAEGWPGEVKVSVSATRKGGIWVATSSGFSCFDGRTNVQSYTAEVGLNNPYVMRTLEAKDGRLYLITGARDVEVFANGKIVAKYPNQEWVTALAEDAESVVAASGGQLYRATANSYVPFTFAPGEKAPPGWVWGMVCGPDNSLWVASTDGLFQVKDGIVKPWTPENGVTNASAQWVCLDGDGVVWAGTTAGIARLKNGRLRYIGRNDGLFDNIIYAIVLDDAGVFWAHSDSGFFRVSRQSLNDFADGKTSRVECTAYTDLTAVKSAERDQQVPAGCKLQDGRIAFATAQGVVLIDPAHMPTNTIRPPVHIDSVRANGRELDRKTVETVPPGKGELEFHFTGLSYIAPQKMLFRYRLDGYDKEWVEAGNRRMAFYTNLKPGRYGFQVIAANADGIWNAVGDVLQLELRPHFYQTTWFHLFCGALACAALVGVYAGRIRQLRRKQKSLQAARDLLEQRVKERTAELAHEREALRESEGKLRVFATQLERSNRELQDFAYVASHDLQEPLRKITVFGERLKERNNGNFDPESQDYVDRMQKATGRMQTLINDLLSFSRVTTKAQPFMPVNLAEIAAGVVEDLEGRIELVKGRVELGNLPVIDAESLQMRQLLQNLIGNALKFRRPEAPPVVKVEAQLVPDPEAPDKPLCRLTVSDNCIGFEEKYVDRIFNVFQRLHTRNEYEGTGMGLAIVRKIALYHGGDITAKSKPGEGSTFIVTIPAVHPKPAEPDQPHPEAPDRN
jgi:signal transduction histidine kinase/ligand-binding sensor domain-containing protein